jgi:formate hydrogenlyase transcriptional activator
LQEQELERLGSARTLKVDVRLIAATHRDLAQMAARGAFRQDLFYRLHVFPVRLPPLRERREDVPALVRHFVQTFARRGGKTIDTIATEAMEALARYDWPGNVRELEHLIERAVILSPGRELRVPLADLAPRESAPAPGNTLQSAERELIRQALEACGWVVGGPGGAAARLGMKRTTLLARMKKLKLQRPRPASTD